MITYGTVYFISRNFNKALEFYRKLFERDVVSQNKTRFACFQIDGFGLSIMNGYYDVEHPEDVIHKGSEWSTYDDMVRIANSRDSGKIVINLCADNLKKEYERIKELGLGSELTDIRYINAGQPYWYFCLKDFDENIIEITGNYEEGEAILRDSYYEEEEIIFKGRL